MGGEKTLERCAPWSFNSLTICCQSTISIRDAAVVASRGISLASALAIWPLSRRVFIRVILFREAHASVPLPNDSRRASHHYG